MFLLSCTRMGTPVPQIKSPSSPPGAGQHVLLGLPAVFYRGLSLLPTPEVLAVGSKAQRGHRQAHPLLQPPHFACHCPGQLDTEATAPFNNNSS